jgi:outer membrane protein
MTSILRPLALLALAATCGAAQAQLNTAKAGVTRYDTTSRTTGISGIGIPAGADARTGDATTMLFTFERELMPHLGVELVLGVPPKITAQATGSVAFLGEVMSARTVAPTLMVNWHFGESGDRWRPYLGAGINYTRFSEIRTPYGWDVHLSDSVGAAVQAGIDMAIDKNWGAWASVAALKVNSDLTAIGAVVLRTNIDFRPTVYSAGISYRF